MHKGSKSVKYFHSIVCTYKKLLSNNQQEFTATNEIKHKYALKDE